MKQTGRSVGKRVALGWIVTLAAYLGLLAFSAFLLEQGRVGERYAVQCVILCASLAAFAGAKTAAHGMTKPAVLTMVCIGTVYCTTILLGFLINDTLDMGRAAALAASTATGGGCALLLRIGKRSGKHARHTRR